MKNLFFFMLSVSLILTPFVSIAQNDAEVAHLIGVWKGTSICQVKDSPCHDETEVCYINKASKENTFKIAMNKVVDGKEDEMGTLEFIYEKNNKTLTCTRDDRLKSVWKFKVNGNSIKGTLTTNGIIYRIIDLTKKQDE